MIMEVRHELSESVIGFDGIELLEDESTLCFLILGRVFRFLIFIQTTTIIDMIKITIANEIQMTVVVEWVFTT